MKKKTKILIAIIGVLIVSALIIFGINELSKYKTYSAKITQIEGKRIIIRDSDNIEYQLYTNDIKINDDGKNIDISNLNIGDNIKIIIKDEIKRDIAMTPKLLQNVKLIKVLEKNLNNVKPDTTKNENNKASTTIKAVVVNAEKGLLVMGIENTGDLYDVNYENKDNIKFKQGQEILIYFNGGMLETYPAQIINVEKIEILKEKSDIKIPEDILRFCYNSRNKVNVSVSELTRTGIEIIIKDTNELQYEYSNYYKINKKVKNKDYTGVGYQYHQDWDNGKNNLKKFTEVTTEDIEQFIDEINNAEFIEGTNLDFYSIKKKQAHLYFRMKDGTTINIRLNEDGYVSYEGWSSNVIIKVDTETFRKIFNEATPEIYTYSEGK